MGLMLILVLEKHKDGGNNFSEKESAWVRNFTLSYRQGRVSSLQLIDQSPDENV